MTQQSRTTESISRDNAAIRDIMHRIRELTVPDRATLALGLIGHLATMMNRSQMTKLMDQLQEEARRVQDVPPSRQRDADARQTPSAGEPEPSRDESRSGRSAGSASAGRASAGTESGREENRESRGGGADRGLRGTSRGGGTAQRAAGRGVAPLPPERLASDDGVRGEGRGEESRPRQGVGQAGRGEFRSRRLL